MLARSHVERALHQRQRSAVPAAAGRRAASSCISTSGACSRVSSSTSTSAPSCSSASCSNSASIAPQRRRGSVAMQATAAADPATQSSADTPPEEMEFSRAAGGIVQYALNFATVAETYEAHSWMLLLGLLKQEDCRAAKILKDLGLTDLYGAWNEVLWALNVSSGLEPRAYAPNVAFAMRASRIITGSQNFAFWGGRTKVQSEDILMALAAGQVLSGLFPDLGLTFDNVRQAAARHGCKYKLPDDTEEQVQVLKEQEDNFL